MEGSVNKLKSPKLLKAERRSKWAGIVFILMSAFRALAVFDSKLRIAGEILYPLSYFLMIVASNALNRITQARSFKLAITSKVCTVLLTAFVMINFVTMIDLKTDIAEIPKCVETLSLSIWGFIYVYLIQDIVVLIWRRSRGGAEDDTSELTEDEQEVINLLNADTPQNRKYHRARKALFVPIFGIVAMAILLTSLKDPTNKLTVLDFSGFITTLFALCGGRVIDLNPLGCAYKTALYLRITGFAATLFGAVFMISFLSFILIKDLKPEPPVAFIIFCLQSLPCSVILGWDLWRVVKNRQVYEDTWNEIQNRRNKVSSSSDIEEKAGLLTNVDGEVESI